METTEFRIVRGSTRERGDVLKLLAEHIPGTDVSARHDWLYERNPHGRSVTMIAYDTRSGEPAGLTSVFPRWVGVGGAAMRGSMGGDGYVRPKFRRKGLATALHRACLEQMREEGIQFMFGPPEPANLRALVRAGSRIVTQVRRYVLPRPLRYLGAATRAVLGRGAPRLVPLDAAGRTAERFCERLSASDLVVPRRDPAFYAWRFGGSPSRRQQAFAVVEGARTIGICALEKDGDRVAIVDLVAPPDALHDAAQAAAVASGAESATVQLNEEGPGAAALWRAGFMPREAKPFQVFALGDGPAYAPLFEARRWYYTWGDGDLDQLGGPAQPR